MTALLALLLTCLVAVAAPISPVRAQANDSGSFLDPFPEGDRYRVQVLGDQMGEGLLEGLAELMAGEPRFQIEKKHRWLGGIMKADADQEAKTADTALASGAPHIAVMMLGAGDRVPFRRASGNRRFGVGSDEWKEEYARRLDVIMRVFRKRNVAVFWVGLPVMRRDDASTDAEMMNEIFRGRALANGVRFIDIYESFADADKSYNPHGPDITGKQRLLRDQDGVHFTGAGYRKLAYFVERELKRAATQAWDERTIPLAGNEAEQARVRPPATIKLAPLGAAPKLPGGPEAAGARMAAAAGRPFVAPDAGGGVKAETSRITLRSIGEQGREENVTLDILRPEIPASVVALLTRRESNDKPTQIGDTVMTEILGGVTVVSSITPLGEGASERRRGTADQASPMHRVLQRGEAMPPKPGRADEMPWPRPEPVLDPKLAKPLQPEAAVATSAAQPTPVPAAAEAPTEPVAPRRPTKSAPGAAKKP